MELEFVDFPSIDFPCIPCQPGRICESGFCMKSCRIRWNSQIGCPGGHFPQECTSPRRALPPGVHFLQECIHPNVCTTPDNAHQHASKSNIQNTSLKNSHLESAQIPTGRAWPRMGKCHRSIGNLENHGWGIPHLQDKRAFGARSAPGLLGVLVPPPGTSLTNPHFTQYHGPFGAIWPITISNNDIRISFVTFLDPV